MHTSIPRFACALLVALMVTMILVWSPLFAQKKVSGRRADGQVTPLLVYSAVGSRSGCAPLAVISHGAGGSENAYRYLGKAISQSGFTTVVMGHRESGRAALRAHIRGLGFLQGVRALVAAPQAEQARLLDVGAALQWANNQCRAPFRVLVGHSMGAETVMIEAGARNMIGITSPPAGQDRFDAYVALSPEGSGIVFPEHAWSGIHKPLLILTGTRDQPLQGGPEARLVPWHDLPGDSARQCQWIGVIEGATHMNFAGNGIGADRVEPMVTQTIASFLNGAQRHVCTLPIRRSGITLQAK